MSIPTWSVVAAPTAECANGRDGVDWRGVEGGIAGAGGAVEFKVEDVQHLEGSVENFVTQGEVVVFRGLPGEFGEERDHGFVGAAGAFDGEVRLIESSISNVSIFHFPLYIVDIVGRCKRGEDIPYEASQRDSRGSGVPLQIRRS